MNVSGLISEDGESLSLGKCSFWILLAVSSYFWFSQLKFPETLYYFFSYILLYNFGKKGLNVVTDIIPTVTNKETKESK